MKFFKKARELFDRLTGKDHDAAVPAPAQTTAPVEQVLDPRYAYRRVQRSLAQRAKATKLVWASWSKALGGQGTMVKGRNAAKRSLRARLEPEYGRRWKKQHPPRMDLAVSA